VVSGRRGPIRQDPIGAVIRVSVTDRCNFRCRYCMPATGVPKLRHRDLLSLERLADTVSWLCHELGVSRVKLTGGEPLVRGGVADLVRALAAIPGVNEVSATTNGARLVELARPLREAGLARVNVSVDSLDSQRFAELTRGGRLADTLAGIEAALDCGLAPVKLNAVLLASSWRSDVAPLLDFAATRSLEVRFIELMRTGTEVRWAEREYVPADEVRRWLETRTEVVDGRMLSAGPARMSTVLWRGDAVRVGWITPRSQPFCDSCSRLRLDARGRVRRCLMDPVPFDLVGLLQTTRESEVRRRLRVYLGNKIPSESMESTLPMVSMGG
jgi:cyclic pyranopterin phosphate synthase